MKISVVVSILYDFHNEYVIMSLSRLYIRNFFSIKSFTYKIRHQFGNKCTLKKKEKNNHKHPDINVYCIQMYYNDDENIYDL